MLWVLRWFSWRRRSPADLRPVRAAAEVAASLREAALAALRWAGVAPPLVPAPGAQVALLGREELVVAAAGPGAAAVDAAAADLVMPAPT
jgi:hypothetical protein